MEVSHRVDTYPILIGLEVQGRQQGARYSWNFQTVSPREASTKELVGKCCTVLLHCREANPGSHASSACASLQKRSACPPSTGFEHHPQWEVV